jgi:Cu/Ag efflux pump CusA
MVACVRFCTGKRRQRIHATKSASLLSLVESAFQNHRVSFTAVAVVLAGLLPILLGHGAGSEVMQRIAAPMVSGMVTAPVLSMLVFPGVQAPDSLPLAPTRPRLMVCEDVQDTAAD